MNQQNRVLRIEEEFFYKDILVLSSNSVWIHKFLLEFHSSTQSGHSGFHRTYHRITTNLFWFGMKKQVQQFVQECDVCQRQKYVVVTLGGLLQPLPISSQIWEDV